MHILSQSTVEPSGRAKSSFTLSSKAWQAVRHGMGAVTFCQKLLSLRFHGCLVVPMNQMVGWQLDPKHSPTIQPNGLPILNKLSMVLCRFLMTGIPTWFASQGHCYEDILASTAASLLSEHKRFNTYCYIEHQPEASRRKGCKSAAKV